MPSVVEETQRLRNQLRRREAQLSARLLLAWETILQNALEEYQRIAALSPSESRSERLLRMNVLIDQIQGQIRDLSAVTGQQVQQLAGEAAEEGARTGAALLHQPVMDLAFGQLNVESVVSAFTLTRTEAFRELFQRAGDDAVQKAADLVVAAVANGWHPERLARLLRTAIAGGAARSLIIARDQTARAYNTARLDTYRTASDVVLGWTWICSLRRTTCAMCWAMHGTNHPLDEEFASHPGCACSPAPYLGQTTIKTGEERFAEQPAKVQRAVLGTDSAYEAYRTGRVALSTFVGYREDAVWGPGRYQRSLKRISEGVDREPVRQIA